jgi:hypothetical protein
VAYLGNDLQVAFPTYRNIDDISGSFNGVTTSFPLTVDGVAPIPAPVNSQQCLISVNGVVQRPDDSGAEGFLLSGGNIVFASAPAGGVDFFGVILAGADYINIGANFPSGTALVPSITFDSDLDTGIYNPAGNQIGFTTAGVQRLVINSSGQVSGGLGSATTPAFSFLSDPNTGIYSPGADQVAVATNGAGRLFVDASGRVGINISTGITQLLNLDEVGATNTFIRFTNNGTSKVGFFGLSSSGSGVFQSNSELVFGTGGAYDERLRITSAGLVGIGTSVPNHKLHIHSTGNTPAYLRSTNDGTGTGTTDGIVIGMGDATNAYLWNYENGGIVFATNATQRAVIDSAGRVGIGTASPNYNLQVAGTDPTIAINALNASASSVSTLLYRNADGNGNPRNVASIEGESAGNGGYGALAFHTAFNDSLLERFRCDASGRLLIGTSTARSNFYNGSTDSPAFQIEGTSSNSAHASIVRNQGGEGPTLILGCSGGTSLGSNTLVSNGDRIGHINFQATDGAEFVQAANIKAEVDGTPGADDMPGRLVFSTTADGAGSPTERMRISSEGSVLVGTTTDSGSVSNTTPVVAGRFYSFNGSSSAASGSAITMFTAPNTNATYMVVARLPSVQDAANYEAVTLLSANAGASVSLVATPLKTGGLLTISLSGTDVQATQGAGGPATISWVVTRIG